MLKTGSRGVTINDLGVEKKSEMIFFLMMASLVFFSLKMSWFDMCLT